MSQCLICGQPMKIVPAGVSSKTGRAYNAFEACPNKCKQPSSYNQTSASPTFDKSYKMIQDKKIEGMYNEKKDNIKWLNSKILSKDILIAAYNKGELISFREIIELLEEVSKQIYGQKSPLE